jgi:integrase
MTKGEDDMAYGQGSIYWDEARGLWIGQVELGEINGKRQRRRATAKTKAAVIAKMKVIQATAAKGLPVANQITTTGDWLNWWAAEILPHSVQPKTLDSYRWILKTYVIPHVGKIPLTKLAPEHVEGMMRKLEARGLSPRTIAYSRAILRRGLAIAIKRGRLVINVAALVDAPPKAASKLDDALDASETSAVLQAASGDRLEALAVLVLAVGLRQGEALSLRWSDVDLEAGSVTVVKAKTEAGERTIALPAFVVSSLKAHYIRQIAERLVSVYWADPEWVFASTTGTKLDPRNVLRWWHALTIDAGVGRRRFHASRHTAATLMLNNGVPLEVVSATLGHAGLAITADVYAKVRPQLQRKAADIMHGLLG